MNKDIFHHEKIYRDGLDRIAQTHITICGAGAIGSNLTDNLVRQGFARIRVVDFDRVEQHNINTQLYSKNHVGSLKVAALKGLAFQAVGVEIETESKKLDEKNVKKFLKGTNLVVDAFDNSESRKIVTEFCLNNNLSCLHVGLSGGDYSEVIWNKNYKVPQDTGEDSCDNPMTRNSILLAVAVATEEIINFVNNNKSKSYSITLKDLKIHSR